jgi:GNAT superfamily N-acetyltransferase
MLDPSGEGRYSQVIGCAKMEYSIRTYEESDRHWARALLYDRWGSARIVTRGRIHQADRLPGFVAEGEGQKLGLLTYSVDDKSCEVISLDSLVQGQGVAHALLEAVEAIAREKGCKRLWLITTNDNHRAIEFYQRQGFTIAAIHHGAIARARQLKPEIPSHGQNGVPIHDEWEFERWL